MAQVKSSYGIRQKSIRFRVVQVSKMKLTEEQFAPIRIDYVGLSELAAGDLVKSSGEQRRSLRRRVEKHQRIRGVVDWLREYLKDGPKPSTEGDEQIRIRSFKKRDVDAAREELGVTSERIVGL